MLVHHCKCDGRSAHITLNTRVEEPLQHTDSAPVQRGVDGTVTPGRSAAPLARLVWKNVLLSCYNIVEADC